MTTESEGRRSEVQNVIAEVGCGVVIAYDRLYVTTRTLHSLRFGDFPFADRDRAVLEKANVHRVIRGTRTSNRVRTEDAGPMLVITLGDAIGEGSIDTPERVERFDNGEVWISRESWSKCGPDAIVLEFAEQEVRRPGLRPIVAHTPGRRRTDLGVD